MSGRPLRLLILEDRPEDAELALRELRRAGFDPSWRRVDDEAGFKANLDPELDLILADYHQPQFDAVRGLKLMQEAGLEIPFVIVSGAVGDDLAVAAVRQGAMDYVLKDRLGRLGTAVKNALEQAELRRRQRLAQAALEHHALHDGLTNLPNRLMLREELDRAIGGRNRATVSLLLLDIDNFKEINDSFGHQVGDILLRQIGPRLRERLEVANMVARLGGDEFAILLPAADAAEASRVAHGLLRSLERPFLSEEHALEVTASIGIAVCPDHGTAAETLLQRADVAMYAAKRSGGSYAVYRTEDDPSRWHHAERGWVPPAEFIPVAERMGLIKPLTAHLVQLALTQSRAWEKAAIATPLAVNVSMRNLLDPRFPQTLEDTMATTGVDPSRIKLEITESAVMAEPARVLETMHRLRSAGVRFSIDDFGTGYSSLAYLQRLPVEEIKIDRSFVAGLTKDEGSAAIVRATIELAANLGLEVVAEGVEDEATLQILKRLGCSTAQGYHISRPIPVEEVAGWIRDRSASSADRPAA